MNPSPYIIQVQEKLEKDFETMKDLTGGVRGINIDLESINHIGGLPVEVKMSVFKTYIQTKYVFNLSIVAIRCMESNGEGAYCQRVLYMKNINTKEDISLQSLTEVFESLKVLIKSLKFNKYKGKFEKEESSLECCFFGNEFKVGGDCSVCLEYTQTRSECNHYICVECYSGLKRLKCPQCRHTLYHIEDELGDDRGNDSD